MTHTKKSDETKEKLKAYYSEKAQVGDILDIYASLKRTPSVRDNAKIFYKQSSETEDVVEYVRELKGLEFVVEKTAMDGGGYGRSGLDTYADGWHITARQLELDGTYNPKGKRVDFYQSGDSSPVIRQVKVVGKMKMGFTRIE